VASIVDLTVFWQPGSIIKGELNPNNKLGLNDSFSTRINKYNPHTVQFCVI